MRGDSQLLVFVAIQPVLFTLLFIYVFGGAISGSSRRYIQYVIPGIIVQTVVFSTMLTGTGPLLGFRFTVGRSSAVGGGGHGRRLRHSLVVAPGADRAVGAQPGDGAVGRFIWMFPLTFASSAFAPPATMPRWLQPFVRVNPITAIADALRALLLGGPAAAPVLRSVAWVVGLTVVFAPLGHSPVPPVALTAPAQMAVSLADRPGGLPYVGLSLLGGCGCIQLAAEGGGQRLRDGKRWELGAGQPALAPWEAPLVHRLRACT